MSNKNISQFTISSWVSMANDDLKVAHIKSIPPFIRGYHAQQAVEKMLKAAFIVTAGIYRESGYKLNRRNHKNNCNDSTPNMPSCYWELINVKFPVTHDIVCLWELLRTRDDRAFIELNQKQKDSLNDITKCAVLYRYPYFPRKSLFPVSFPSVDVDEVVAYVSQLFNDLYDYICKKSTTSQAI